MAQMSGDYRSGQVSFVYIAPIHKKSHLMPSLLIISEVDHTTFNKEVKIKILT